MAQILADSRAIAIKMTISDKRRRMGLSNDVPSLNGEKQRQSICRISNLLWTWLDFFWYQRQIEKMWSQWAPPPRRRAQSRVVRQQSALCDGLGPRPLIRPRSGVSPGRLNICWQAVRLDAYPTRSNWSSQANFFFPPFFFFLFNFNPDRLLNMTDSKLVLASFSESFMHFNKEFRNIIACLKTPKI